MPAKAGPGAGIVPQRRPRLGQHFLADGRYRERIMAALEFTPGDCWVEIGAGRGEMSALLAERAHRLVAVELDHRLLPELRERLEAFSNAEVREADILRVDLDELAKEAGTPLKLFGNLPYYITTPILKHLFRSAPSIAQATVLVQREVAERLAARPGTSAYGSLSGLTQFHSRPELLFDIPPGAFRPAPDVSSALVRLRMPGAGATLDLRDPERFLRFVASCFASKRKTLLNNLRGRFGQRRIEESFKRLSLPARVRAEELGVVELAALWQLLEGE